MNLTERTKAIIEKYGFSLGKITEQDGDYYVDLNQGTPAGEDWYVVIWFDGTTKDFILKLRDYYTSFDVDEEVEPYISMRGKNGVPNSISELIEDEKWKEELLEDLSDDLMDTILGNYSKEYICKDILKINDVIVANKGDEIIISDAVPAEDETLEDVDGYCDIENITKMMRFNATYLDIDYSVLKEIKIEKEE